jgi:hypothetical protein
MKVRIIGLSVRNGTGGRNSPSAARECRALAFTPAGAIQRQQHDGGINAQSAAILIRPVLSRRVAVQVHGSILPVRAAGPGSTPAARIVDHHCVASRSVAAGVGGAIARRPRAGRHLIKW